MDFQVNTPSEIIEKVSGFAGDLIKLNRTEVIERIIPKDAIFAVLIESIEKNPDETFTSASVTPTLQGGISLRVGSDQGLANIFNGFLVVLPGKVQIYSPDQLYLEAAARDVSVDIDHGTYVLHLPTKKFKLSRILPINTLSGRFASSASGMLSATPLLNQLESQGATVKRISKAKTLAVFVIFILVFGGIVFLAALKK